ncbi:MAG: hypothetical protein LH471_07555 [Salinibacterium sp.]|nr:hypothetical protein [Salinibacterium sp.]
MTTSHRTVEDRLASYRQPLDLALEQKPALAVDAARPDRAGEADFLGFDDVEPQEHANTSAWPRYAVAAASLVLLVGAGLMIALRIDSSAGVSSNILDDTAPVACPSGSRDVGNPAPELDFDNPGFLAALPLGTPPRVLAVRALLNPAAGDRCLAFGAGTIDTSLDQSTNTVTVKSVPPAGPEFEARLTIAQSADAIGVTEIKGMTPFTIDQSKPTATLKLRGDLPATATQIGVTFRLGNEVSEITVPISSASAIALRPASGSDELEGDLVWVVFVIRDGTGLNTGAVLDIGGRPVP